MAAPYIAPFIALVSRRIGMSLQGPILIVANKPPSGLAQAFTEAGAFPIIEASWAGAPTAAAEVKPSAIVLSEPDAADRAAAAALARHVANAVPLHPDGHPGAR